jgi:hypothetical protein
MAIIRIFDNFVQKAGDSISGDITMLSGASIFTSVSGVNTIGSPDFPFEAVYANSIIGSGLTSTAIQSGTNLGGGEDIFSDKNLTNLEFRTVSGVGNISVTVEGDVVVFSGTGDGNGDVIGPASSTINAVALFTDTSGKLIKNSSVLITGGDTLNANTVSGTNVNTDVLTIDNLDGVLFATGGLVSGSATTTQLPEGTNLYYTEAKVNANPVVSGNSLQIDQNTADLITVSGLTVTNAGDIATNATNIANVSGIAATAIQSGASLGTGSDIFSAKNGTDLEFNTVEGKGNVTVTIEGNNVVVSGTGDGNGDVQGPASATDDALAVYNGTTGKVIKNSTASVSDITDNTANIATVSGVAAQNTIDIATNAGDIATVSGVAAQNTIDIATNTTNIATVSGVASQNTIDIATNAGDIATVSGVAAQNTIDIATNAGDIATVSGVAAQNTIDIATVSGVAATAIQSGTSLGTGSDVFSAKNGTDLEFNTVEGKGNVTVTIEGNNVVVSGTGDGNGDVQGPASATDDAIAVYDGTTGKFIKNSSASVSDITDNATNIATVSGVAAQNTIDIATNAGDIATVSGVAAQNTIDIATNAGDIATVSGVAATAIQSGVNIGAGVDIFAQKNGTNLEYKTLIAGENTFITSDANTVTISGVDTSGIQENYAFSYDTTTQAMSGINTLTDISFDTNGELNGWTHTASTSVFTCPETARYLVSYDVVAQKTAASNSTIEIIGLFNGTEVPGSQISSELNANNRPQAISKTFIVNATATQVLKLQMAAGNANTEVVPKGSNASTAVSASITITKL